MGVGGWSATARRGAGCCGVLTLVSFGVDGTVCACVRMFLC